MPKDERPAIAPHVFAIRVYYEDTDAAGIVYYANYLRFAERARSELLHSMGFSAARVTAEQGVTLVVRWCEIDYLAPAKLDDVLEIHTRILELDGARLSAEQTVHCAGRAICRLRLRLVSISREGRPTRMPPELHDAFMALVQPGEAA